MSKIYGAEPVVIGKFTPVVDEMFFYQDMPIIFPGNFWTKLPERLEFMRPMVMACILDANQTCVFDSKRYMYVSAKRLYVNPGTNFNRIGWHVDGFGTEDVNYVWCDSVPTEYYTGRFDNVSDDHLESMVQFSDYAKIAEIKKMGVNTIYRIDNVIHTTAAHTGSPVIRTFLKVSISKNQYNLKGNSHNYLFDYEWEMKDRAAVRNDPHKSAV